MLSNLLRFVKTKREFLVVARAREGWGKGNIFFGGVFRKAKYEIRRRRKGEGGQKFLPPNPLPFCPPELQSFSKFSDKIFAKKSSDFVQRSEPNCMLRVYCLGASRLGRQIV